MMMITIILIIKLLKIFFLQYLLYSNNYFNLDTAVQFGFFIKMSLNKSRLTIQLQYQCVCSRFVISIYFYSLVAPGYYWEHIASRQTPAKPPYGSVL